MECTFVGQLAKDIVGLYNFGSIKSQQSSIEPPIRHH